MQSSKCKTKVVYKFSAPVTLKTTRSKAQMKILRHLLFFTESQDNKVDDASSEKAHEHCLFIFIHP